MSKLTIKDLERIKNGKLVRYNLFTKEPYKSFVVLDKIQKEINEFNNIRFDLLREFRNDLNNSLDNLRGCKIDSSYRVELDFNKLFLNKYLVLTIPTIFGDNMCLFDENGFVSSNGEITKELKSKINVLLPYIKKIFKIKENSNIINNSFYNDYSVLNNKSEKILNINGNGITLPFNDYTELDDIQSILAYYYTNREDILKNIIIPNTDSLNNYRLDTNKEKVLKLYKGEK